MYDPSSSIALKLSSLAGSEMQMNPNNFPKSKSAKLLECSINHFMIEVWLSGWLVQSQGITKDSRFNAQLYAPTCCFLEQEISLALLQLTQPGSVRQPGVFLVQDTCLTMIQSTHGQL